MTDEEISDLTVLVESNVISNEDKNLRSKVASINRSLTNLLEKKARIDFEIKRQKKSLTRKREELKRVSKRNKVKVSLALESGRIYSNNPTEDGTEFLRKLDQHLFQESKLLLEENIIPKKEK